jgi:hypothetical protein
MRGLSAEPDQPNQLFTEKAPLNLRGFGVLRRADSSGRPLTTLWEPLYPRVRRRPRQPDIAAAPNAKAAIASVPGSGTLKLPNTFSSR